MYIKSETEYQNTPAIVDVVQAMPAGLVIAKADFNTSVFDELVAGAIVGVDSNRLGRIFKTAEIVAGGSASAPRIGKGHPFKVGDFTTEGIVALEISAITVGATYDTFAFTSGELVTYATGTVLYQASAANLTNQGKAATATVQDTAGDYLTITIPVASGPAKFNNLALTISQAADDVLAVSFSGGVLGIALAKTTAANNNLAAVQAAVRALGTIDGFSFAAATATGVDWDNKQTGATLTTPTDLFDGGVDANAGGVIAPKYTPVGITINTIDLTLDNQSSGIMLRGTVNEAVMQLPVDSYVKSLLPHIIFDSQA